MRLTKYSILILVLLIFVSGCAFGTRRPVLKYTIATESQPSKNIRVFVNRFKDERLEKDVIGHVRNAYGMKTAKIIADTNISEWVTGALKVELENIGYTIANDPRSSIKVAGEVIEVYVTSLMLYEGKAAIEVSLYQNDKRIYTEKYLGTDESLNWAATAKSYGITLERSLQKALIEAVHDIDRKLSRSKGRDMYESSGNSSFEQRSVTPPRVLRQETTTQQPAVQGLTTDVRLKHLDDLYNRGAISETKYKEEKKNILQGGR